MNYACLIVVAAFLQADPAPAPGAAREQPRHYSFAERQEQLVDLARLLGQMHHMHKTCQPYDYLPDRFRDRMKEIVALEEPPDATRDQMVAAFNEGFRAAKASYPVCDPVGEAEMQRLGREGSKLTKEIAAPLSDIEGYDYYADPDDETE